MESATYLLLGDASVRSRVGVGIVVLVSLAIWWYYPQWIVVATVLQAAVSIYVLLYLKVNPHAA